MVALCLTVPNFLFRVIFIPAYTNPDKKAMPIKMALTVPKPDYPLLLRSKYRNNAYSATNGSGSGGKGRKGGKGRQTAYFMLDSKLESYY